jgi:hypothetical protein
MILMNPMCQRNIAVTSMNDFYECFLKTLVMNDFFKCLSLFLTDNTDECVTFHMDILFLFTVHRSVPVARTEVWEEEPTSARLRWHRAYIPRYYSSTPISYR